MKSKCQMTKAQPSHPSRPTAACLSLKMGNSSKDPSLLGRKPHLSERPTIHNRRVAESTPRYSQVPSATADIRLFKTSQTRLLARRKVPLSAALAAAGTRTDRFNR